MHRFVEKSINSDAFPGGKPLQKFIIELFNSKNIKFDSRFDFIAKITNALKNYLENEKVFIDTFTIERDKQNIYSLFFFTHHIKGFEVMLETKWELDEQSGRGFKLDPHPTLFTEAETTNYPHKLKDYITHSNRTNVDIYRFGLDNGFLPKHTNMIFNEWQKSNTCFKVYFLNSSLARKGSFYLKEKEQKVIFRFEK